MPAPLAVALVSCLVVGIAGGIWLEPRLHRFLVGRARGSAWRGAAVSAGVQVAVLAAYGVLAAAGAGLGGPVGASVTTAAALAYSPFLMCAIPGRTTGYRDHRVELRRAGARRPVDRGIAWAAGPVALVGTGVLLVGLIPVHAP